MDVQHIAAPVAGKDYPRNWSEFLDWFASEETCLGYLEKLRWPGGFVCPACGVADEPYRSSRSRLMCRSCSHQGFVAVAHGGTSIEDPPGLRDGKLGAMHLAYVRDPDGNKLCALHRM